MVDLGYLVLTKTTGYFLTASANSRSSLYPSMHCQFCLYVVIVTAVVTVIVTAVVTVVRYLQKNF